MPVTVLDTTPPEISPVASTSMLKSALIVVPEAKVFPVYLRQVKVYLGMPKSS